MRRDVTWFCALRGRQLLSALDLLSVSNLVNYIGMCPNTENVEVGT
jgi:hypothetical protein